MKYINLNRLIYIYINERILNRLSDSDKRKLSYTFDVLASNEKLVELKDLMLQNDNDNGFFDMKEKREDQDEDVKDTKK